ncbi:MAG: hypothetical protein P1U56_23715 [Saprospiraceae bacterium]|nr:hypothetical protein [Saprospiraceae bacterium]
MKKHKAHKRELKPKMKDQIGDTFHHGKPINDRVKYNYKNHWLDEEMEEIIPYKSKKKKKTA